MRNDYGREADDLPVCGQGRTTSGHPLGNPDRLSTTYPKYDPETGWTVIANKDGSLRDARTGRGLYGLYWEGTNTAHDDSMSEGSIVKGSNSASFLEDKLSQLGLNDREAEEFIVYWLPRMETNEYNYIRFEDADEIDSRMPLNVSPKPDTTIRVMMGLRPLKASEADRLVNTMKVQKLTETSVRDGLTLVEWGGSEF